jgi:pantetheine-phosphate adenylyltransferase
VIFWFSLPVNWLINQFTCWLNPLESGMSSSQSIAVYAFSADPITNGHINVVERMSRSFERCIVGIGRNPTKNYTFSLEIRKQLALAALKHLPNVEVLAFDGMMVDFAYEQGAKVIIKGVRNAADVDYEQTLHLVGVSQEMGIDTYLLFADPKLAHVSSSVVKAMQIEQGFIHDYVPAVVKAAVEAKVANQLIIGVTGSIASGKTSLCEELVKQAEIMSIPAHHINIDQIAHELLEGKNIAAPLFEEIKIQLMELLGEEIRVDGVINRQRIANKIFSDAKLLREFNKVLEKPMSMLLRRNLKNKQGILLLDSALLLDVDWLQLINYRCILCSVSDYTQSARMRDRGYSDLQSQQRLLAQYSNIEKENKLNQAIAEAGYGKLWKVDTETVVSKTLLNDIIRDCEEWKWTRFA